MNLSTRRTSLLALSPLLVAAGLLWAPRSADACGGTFCDNLPNPMPVDQRGEDILFVMDGSTIEVQVRIEYTGEAERFAWVLPIQSLPEITVGSDPLFTAMSNALAPSWQVQTSYDCDEDDPWGGDDGGGFSPKFDAGGDPGPDVVLEAVVGAFEVVVLQGGTAQEVIDFLNDNNYAQDPDAAPILQSYLDEGFLFAAVKLAAGADTEDIHPLSFKFQGTEPCVPIRLTRIAAKDDMGIRAYFLGQDRWAPSNYDHVELNPLAFNWQQSQQLPATTYNELLSMAVDEAGGQAFVTEYAGSPDKVENFNIYRPTWDETAFVGVDPITAIDIIGDQGLNVHPLIQALLLEFIPPPDGIDATDFWNNIEDFADQIDLMAWDDLAFAAAVLERIIEPGLHAIDLLDTWPKLTRLNTTISPSEMTLDPTFHANPDLPNVTNTTIVTNEQVLCGGDSVFHVDVDGDDMPVCVPEGANYPGWEAMPYALRIEQVPQMGPPQVGTDNTEAIAAAYAAYQGSVECLADGGGTGDTGGTGPGDGDGDSDGGGSGADDGGGSETGPGYDLPYDVSCGCSTKDGRAPIGVALGLLVLGLIGPWRRRAPE